MLAALLPILAAAGWINAVLYTVYTISIILVILFVLFRPSESGGLSGAFGGMGGDQAFGMKTTQLIDKIIMVISTLFIVLAIIITVINKS